MDILLALTLVFLAILLLTELFYAFRIPVVLSYILIGIALSIPAVKSAILGSGAGVIVTLLADLGIIFLMFLAGMQIKWNQLYGSSREVIAIGIFGAAVPFLLGFLLMKSLNFSTITALVTGIALSITSEGTKERDLLEIGKLHTRLGSIMVGTGILDDMLGIAAFLAAAFLLGKHVFTPVASPWLFLAFIAVIWLTFKYLHRIIVFEEHERKQTREVSLFTTTLLIALLFAVFGKLVSGTITGALVTAFIAGIIVQLSLRHSEEQLIQHHFEVMALSFVVPFFFIETGLQFDFSALSVSWPLALAILLTGTAGKLLGALVAKPFTKLSWQQLHLVGWGLNSRGAVELVIALLALRFGMIPPGVYSAIVVMTLVTTFLFPLALDWSIAKYPRIMSR